MPPVTLAQALQVGLQHHQTGNLSQAEAVYRQILASDPNNPDALHLCGVIAHQNGNNRGAVELISRAIALSPQRAAYYFNLGAAFQKEGLLWEAITSFKQALVLKPSYPEAHNNLGNAFQTAGRLDEAITCYKRALAQKPDFAAAEYNMGGALQKKGLIDEAIICFRQTLILKPDYPGASDNLGTILKRAGRLDEAIVCFRQALTLAPDSPEAHHNLASALAANRQPEEASVSYKRALSLKADFPEALANLGNTLKDMGQIEEAIACYRRALELRPDFAIVHSNLLYALQFHPEYDASTIAEEHRRWDRQHAEPLKKFLRPHSNDRNPDRCLKIGYVSPDFYNHTMCHVETAPLESHSHEEFEIHCYASISRPDEVTARIRGCADEWHDVLNLTDEALAEKIRADQIDILVDLTMHMGDNRLKLFARKPAPVQVAWLAYPGTTGLSTMDYRLTDPYLDPPGLNDHFYSEKSVRLPDCFWCYEPMDMGTTVAPLPAASNGFITFGSLNNFCKVNSKILRLWAQVLDAVTNSRLLLLAPPGNHRQDVWEVLQDEGVSADRVEFASLRPRPDYLELYHRIDIGLDPLPYNGHTTSFDSFWMGVPIVSLIGWTLVGRAGLCQLMNLGLPELTATTPEQFVRIAAELAGDLPRLTQLRSTLRQRLKDSPLMNGPRFARNLENAYRQMWRDWCQSDPTSPKA